MGYTVCSLKMLYCTLKYQIYMKNPNCLYLFIIFFFKDSCLLEHTGLLMWGVDLINYYLKNKILDLKI